MYVAHREPGPGRGGRRRAATAAVAAAVLALAPLGALVASGAASAQPSGSTAAFNSLTAESHPDWMGGLPDGTPLGALSVPGTHDTLAIHGGLLPSAYEAQEDHGDGAATLDAQLTAGVRAIDIRVRVIGGAFAIHHTDVYQNANFDDVLTHARSFLAAHPTETVLMDLHGECDADSTEGGSGSSRPGSCADDPPNTTAAQRTAIFDGYVSRYPGLFYAPTVTGSGGAPTPTLGQARGHIVLTTFTGPRGQMYTGYGLTQLSTGDWSRYVENDWTQCNLASKWSEAQANIAKAGTDTAGNMYVTYTSASCAPFGAGPADMAGGYLGGTGENQRALDYLGGGNALRTGLVMMDYPGHALISAIIRLQPRGPGQVTSGVAGRCLDDFQAADTDGAMVDLWSCNASAAQQWTYAYASLRINGKCLDVPGSRTGNGTPVELWTCNGGRNQRWTAVDGQLVSDLGVCLDDPAGSATDGVALEVWSCNGGTNQQWRLP